MEKIVYQLHVKGYDNLYAGNSFKCSSKKIYMNRPTQKDIDEFIHNCAHPDNAFLPELNINAHYDVYTVELILIEN